MSPPSKEAPSALSTLLFDGEDDLSDPPTDGENHHQVSMGSRPRPRPRHATTKRPRAPSTSPEGPAEMGWKPINWERLADLYTGPSRSPPPAPLASSDVDVEMDFDKGVEREDEDEIMGGDSDEVDMESEDEVEFDRHSRAALVGVEGGIIGKGKGVNRKAPSSNKPSAPTANKISAPTHKKAQKEKTTKPGPHRGPTYHPIMSLEKDIPPTYEALGDPLEEDELFELDWFAPTNSGAKGGKPSKKGKKNPMAPPPSSSPPTRSWHSFTAPRMTLDQELDDFSEVGLSDGTFCFPFKAQVIKYFRLFDRFLMFHCVQITDRQGLTKILHFPTSNK
jgi:hypothetical protein